jgi:hypothetical protein
MTCSGLEPLTPTLSSLVTYLEVFCISPKTLEKYSYLTLLFLNYQVMFRSKVNRLVSRLYPRTQFRTPIVPNNLVGSSFFFWIKFIKPPSSYILHIFANMRVNIRCCGKFRVSELLLKNFQKRILISTGCCTIFQKQGSIGMTQLMKSQITNLVLFAKFHPPFRNVLIIIRLTEIIMKDVVAITAAPNTSGVHLLCFPLQVE